MKRRTFWTLGLSFLLTAASAGCSDQSGRVAIDGTVKFKDGQLIDRGTISFSPLDKDTKFTSGAPIIDGRYHVPREKGLGEGRYVVRIYSSATTDSPTGPPGFGMATPEERVSPQFNTQSKLTVEVQGAEDQHFDFEVE